MVALWFVLALVLLAAAIVLLRLDKQQKERRSSDPESRTARGGNARGGAPVSPAGSVAGAAGAPASPAGVPVAGRAEGTDASAGDAGVSGHGPDADAAQGNGEAGAEPDVMVPPFAKALEDRDAGREHVPDPAVGARSAAPQRDRETAAPRRAGAQPGAGEDRTTEMPVVADPAPAAEQTPETPAPGGVSSPSRPPIRPAGDRTDHSARAGGADGANRADRPADAGTAAGDGEPADRAPQRRGLGKLIAGLGGASRAKGAGVAAGAAAAGATAVGLGAAHRGAGERPEEGQAADRSAAAPGTEGDGREGTPDVSGTESLAGAQERWLEARAFAEVPVAQSPVAGERDENLAGAHRAFVGTFRGSEVVVSFAGPRTVFSISRPGPATTAFSMERTRGSAADPAGAPAGGGTDAATVEQMTLRADDEAADALLDDPRVMTALRGAPADFSRCDVSVAWGHTSVAEEALPQYDGCIVTLHALVSAAAALPAGRGAPLDLEQSDPGNAGVGRELAEGEQKPPRVVDSEEFDTDVEDLGDDLDAESAQVDDTAATFAPRGNDRPGHLRLVKTSGSGSGAAAAGAAGAGAVAAGAGAARVVSGRDDDEREDDERGDDAEAGETAETAGTTESAEPAESGERVESTGSVESAEPGEPDPFEQAMRSDAVPADRGDVAADFLPQRAPVPRPSRGTAARYGDDEDMPALAEPELGEHGTDGAGFKPLGASDDDEEESSETISAEVRRFESARLTPATAEPEAAETEAAEPEAAETEVEGDEGAENGADVAATEPEVAREPGAEADTDADAEPDVDSAHRHSGGSRRADGRATQVTAASLAASIGASGRTGGGRHRRVDEDDNENEGGNEDEGGNTGENTGGNGDAAADPDFVETTRFRRPDASDEK